MFGLELKKASVSLVSQDSDTLGESYSADFYYLLGLNSPKSCLFVTPP